MRIDEVVVIPQVAERIACLVPSGCAWPGIVAVSGGADSVALLRALHEHAPSNGLIVAHVNHLLRGAESDADEAFVVALSAKLGRICRVSRVDVNALIQKPGGNMEEAARQARYSFFNVLAVEYGAKWVATGHTADDQAETILHRLIRGTGIQGLRGIAPRRPLADDVLLIRPMLGLTRNDVIDSLAVQGQTYRHDSSNDDSAFTRNRIRHELLPLMRSFNPAVVSVLGRLAEQVDEEFTEQARVTGELLKAVELPRAGTCVIFDGLAVAKLHRSMLRSLLRMVWQRENWPASGMSFAHWERAAAVATGELTAVDFPGGVSIRRIGKVVQAGRR